MKAPSYQPATTFTWTPSGSVASATSTSFAASASATLRTSPRRNASPTSPAVPSATARRSCGPRSRGLAKLVATSGDRTGARARARAPASGDLALAGDRRDGADPLGRDLLVLGALDVPDEAELLQRPDDRVGGVGLEAAQAVAGGGRERVVAVVPALAERDHRDEPVVAALVLDRERPAAVHVADRVDAPGRVVEQEHAHEAGPDEGGEAGEQRAARERKAEHERDRQAEQRPQREVLVDPADRRVLAQVGREALGGGALALEQPAHVGVPEAGQHTAHALGVVRVRGVRVALLVGEGVVAAMVGDPVDHGALYGHRAEDRERRAQPRLRLEGAVGEHP